MIYAFEGYEFDTARLETRRDGELLHVEPQVFDVLVYLIEHRDHMVTKEELLDNIWGDRFVSESALTSRIKSARRLIGDDGSRQRLIRTVYGRGYRFVATLNDVSVLGEQQPLVHDLPAPSQPVPVTVGRDSELVHLRTLVAAARQGERRVVFVAGAAGIGKTTLVERLLADLSFEDPSVGVGQCVEHRGARRGIPSRVRSGARDLRVTGRRRRPRASRRESTDVGPAVAGTGPALASHRPAAGGRGR